MSETKTGNKGFVNPVDGKVYTIDSVQPGAPGANESPAAYDPGNISVDNSVKDISKKTRVTLGTYLSAVTKGIVGSSTVSNKYSIDPSTLASLPSKITTNGFPTPIGLPENSEKFKDILPSSFSEDFSAAQAAPGPVIKKGKVEGPGSDGHSLLPEATADSVSRQLVIDGPVDKYTQIAIEQNRWEPGGAEFTGGADPANPPKDFNVPLQTVATAVFPSEEATDSTNVAYELDLQAAAQVAEQTTENNTFPVVVGNVTLGSTTTADGQHPAPLTPQTDGVFAPYLRNSYNEQDYSQLRVGQPDGLQKGRSPVEGLSGHELLPSVEVLNGQLNGPGLLRDYSTAASEPNRWSNELAGFTGGEDLLNPSKEFNVPLQSIATAVMPNAEAIDPVNAQFNLDLSSAVQVPVQITENSNNFYTVSQPDIASLAALTDANGYPAPLTPAISANDEVHAAAVPPSVTPAYALVANEIIKGKSIDNSRGLGGNELLSDSIKETPFGAQLPIVLKTYTDATISSNRYSASAPILAPEVDPLAPPGNFDPVLRKTEEKGKSSNAVYETLPLGELRKIPSNVTEDNSYPVDSTLYSLNSATDSNGDPVVLDDSRNFSRYTRNRSDIKPLSSDPTLNNFSKGKGDGDYDGHNLLSSISGNRSAVANNRAALPTLDTTPSDHPIRQYKGSAGPLQAGASRFSSSNVRPGFNPTLTLADGKQVSMLQMAKVGTGLSQRASAEIPAWTADKFDPTGNLAEAGAILPSVAQMGILKVNNQLLSAQDVLDSLDLEEGPVPEGALTDIALFGGQSWGSMSNVSEAFDDPGSSLGMLLTMVAMLLALSILYGIIALITSASRNMTPTNSKGQYSLGNYEYKEPSNSLFSLLPDLSEIFGIKPTKNPYSDSLVAGFSSFFLGANGLETGFLGFAFALAGIVLSAGASLFSDNSTLGANVVVCRSIVRSGLVFAEYISGLVRKFQLSAVGGVKAAIGILRVFRSSKFIASLNVFSAMGDQLLNAKNKLIQISGPDGKFIDISPNDALIASFVPQSTVRKHRLFNGLTGYDPTLSWTSKRAPSLYLVPQRIQALQLSDASNTLGSFKGSSVLEQDKAKIKERNFYSKSGTGRIPAEDRKRIERILDAEYVPFYFHDVRTNEIVSFHAFLASLGDSFTAAYDSVEGFGRVEPVKIYKNTTRKIDMSFYVAATSEQDFDHMWHKINKLTTLVYPQYTKGKLLTTGGGSNFRSPFSQLVGASPLVRIRLGDLFRSNYSRFALARLFGAADGDTSLPDSSGSPVQININDPDISKKLQERFANLKVGDTVNVKDKEGKETEAEIVSTFFTNTYTVKSGEVEFLVDKKQASITVKTLKKIIDETGVGDFAVLANFMSPNNNSITKSFESSGGKGLAGFIESMGFDWYDRVTWGTEYGRTAPKMCKVTISFSPIHDISPGIDHLGYNRAPIYPVGAAMFSERQEDNPGSIT